MDSRKIVSSVLNIPDVPDWQVVDEAPGLALVHYNEAADLFRYGWLRGIIVDTEKQYVLSSDPGEIPSMTVTAPITVDGDGFTVHTDSDSLHFSRELTRLGAGYEGSLLRIFLYAGKVYFSTRRKLETLKRRGVSLSELFNTLGGRVEDLFPASAQYSPNVYSFMIVHESTMFVSKQRTDGYMVYMGVEQAYATPHYPLTALEKWSGDSLPLNEPYHQVPLSRSAALTVEEANWHLDYGYHEMQKSQDPRLGQGEFVILNISPSWGGPSRLLRLNSPSYSWREELRKNYDDLERRLFELRADAQQKFSEDAYMERYPVFKSIPLDELANRAESGSVEPWETCNHIPVTTEARFQNIFYCLLVAVPPMHQKKVVAAYRKVLDALDYTSRKLQEIEPRTRDQKADASAHGAALRVSQILKDARNVGRIQAKGNPKRLQFETNRRIITLVHQDLNLGALYHYLLAH